MDKSQNAGRAGYYLYIIPGMLGFTLVVLVPLIANFVISFTTWKGGNIAPRYVGLENYQRLLADTVFWSSIQHTVLFIISMTIVPILLGLVLAAVLFDYISAQFSETWSSFFRAGFYLPQILPLTAAGVLWAWILNPVGIINAVLKGIGLDFLAKNWLGDASFALWAVSAVIVWVQVGYCLVVFMSGLARVDPSLYEAAELDNASWFGRFRYITIPMLMPEIFVVALTTLIAALKVFAPIYVLTSGGPDNATTVPSYLSYYHFFTTNRVGYAAAIATLQTVMTIVLGIVFLRMQSKQEGGR
ncbi:carbohydrate ABC transporter permease [Rhizobium leucaenae]|jgi:raffinose/stachyose/melibiose transport system permease protein|uniref:Raffinose/stachyose/melibiose transport system permease protein n=1 Tax=Rhizobium leucaenae TaxID=29450 RepID=A0A7W7EJF7_9HYPH|nr:sugar ABC transporter permease [Rhizobium leucaenae]MBB4566178.1 raffinose/stachyose/melibiose transport system permease protein [Rhizobium leucaenae]MBB6302500.1 raffinose/stachyose/melibiose transport system permease protein [Rhizobium leucaenae]